MKSLNDYIKGRQDAIENMPNPLGIKIGDTINGFSPSIYDYIVKDFKLVDNKNLSLCNPTTMEKFSKEGAFWAITVDVFDCGRFLHSHLIPIDMIKKEHLDRYE